MFNKQRPSAKTMTILVFRIGKLRCGLREEDVTEVVNAVRVTPLPGAAPIVKGAFSLRGVLTPVLDLRPRLREPPKNVWPTDHFIILRAAEKIVALHVDHTEALVEIEPSTIESADQVTQGEGILAGVAMLADGLMLIADPAKFLSEAERMSLENALADAAS